MKYKELLAEKGGQGFLFNKIVTVSVSSFLTSFSASMTSFFMDITWEIFSLLVMNI